jgi:hypothetical protein
VSPNAVNRWSQSDLIRRVLNAADVARRMVRTIDEIDFVKGDSAISTTRGAEAFLREKVASETAMLLLCMQPIRCLDERIGEQIDVIAKLLIPHARHKDVLAAICLDPGLARDHAFGHVILSRLGYPDRDVDNLLSKSLAMGADFGPERLPHRRLEQAWLDRVWSMGGPRRRSEARMLSDSMLGRPMDALGSTRLDIYAFTHAVMYASDLGGRKFVLPRGLGTITADADAALAYSLDANDFDLTAEILMTWPMIRLRWSSVATFAFGILAKVEDKLSFLPGSTFDLGRYEALEGAERMRFALMTSYHTAYVMGYLCAASLRRGCAPPATMVAAKQAQRAGRKILPLLNREEPTACWREPFDALSSDQQELVAPWLIAILLRRARTQGNLRLIREGLEISLAHDLIDGPAPRQAAALLRRCEALKV